MLRKNKQLGFSLIEVIVVVAIISVMMGVFLVNYRQTEKRSSLLMASKGLITDIRRIQNKAMGLVKYNDSVPEGGWGIYFNQSEPTKYYLFADINNNAEYDVGEAVKEYGGNKIDLPEGVEIINIDIGDDANAVFLPPDPKVYLRSYNPSTVSAENLRITLRELHTQEVKIVSVNFLGLIQLED